MTTPDGWREALVDHRRAKDEYFADHHHSPLPPAEREEFDGLAYYPPDPDFRYALDLRERPDPDAITVETTAGGEREYLVAGSFAFEVGDEAVRLNAYRRPAEGDSGLWLPFRDATNGETTYGGGRYLDLDPEDDREGDSWVVDFNYAYTPFCAYSDEYECPLVPMTNWLEVAVEAGERY